MTTLFDDGAVPSPLPALADLLRPTPQLPATAEPYVRRRRPRAQADPLGLAGMPDTRADLDELLLDLCRRLRAAGPRGLRGRRLVEDLGLPDTRALRHLIAYGHVHHRIRQIVGVPGTGYVWGDAAPEIYRSQADAAHQMGRCHLFLSMLYRREPAATQMAQLVLDFVRHGDGDEEARASGESPRPRGDELSAMMASEGVQVGDVIDALITQLSSTDDGRQVLQRVGDRHADVLIPADRLQAARTALAELQSVLGES
jgi:hypothetical protein